MTRASISEVKAQLSRFLREVRRGGEVQILDRGVPVARLTGLESSRGGPAGERRRRLIEEGILAPGSGDVSALLEQPPTVLGTDLSGALEEERNDRV